MCSLAVPHDLIAPCYVFAMKLARKEYSKMGCIHLLHTNEKSLERMFMHSKQSSKMGCMLRLHTNEQILEHIGLHSKQSNFPFGVQKSP